MSVTGLFSGIGGFEAAFHEAGFDPGLLVEVDASANAVLKKRFPNANVLTDVSDLVALPSSTTILAAGFPCQNLSMAGDKSGIAGSKSGVVKKMFDLISKSRVPIVVIENVYFMLQLDAGNGMKWMVSEFERLGYRWAYRVLDTMGFGLPQRRRRVYFVAALEVDPRTVLFADDRPVDAALKADLTKPLGFYWTEGRSGVGFTIDGIPPLKVGSSWGIPSAPAVLFPDGAVLMPSLNACEQLQGFPSGWTSAGESPATKRGARWRMIGNAVSVVVARWVAERLKSPGKVLDFERLPADKMAKWPAAAWNVGEGMVGVLASDKPISTPGCSIADYRDDSWSRLTDGALDGFINRAVEGGLHMPAGFLEALRKADRRQRNARSENVPSLC